MKRLHVADPHIRVLVACTLLCTVILPTSAQAPRYEPLDKSIECLLETAGVFGAQNTFIQSTIEIGGVQCSLGKAGKRKSIPLKSKSGASGFIETKDFGRIKFEQNGRLFMQNEDQARLKRFLEAQ